MTHRICFAASLLLLTACGSSPDSRFYTLSDSRDEVMDTARDGERFTLADVQIPGLLDKPQIVVKHGDNKVEVLEYDRWAEPLDGMFTRVLADDLVSRGALSTPAEDSKNYGHRIEVTVDEMDGDRSSDRVTLKARWSVTASGAQKQMESQVFDKSEPADGGDINAIVAAESKLIGELAEAILAK